ncbi:predicted Zn-dependent hydrolases [Pelotomaculum thermopropionicum SI]|uniref:Predicted Zn-dependent hydrolases n=1 Tax=Pelotomaculum thermopropionicum (strain DSM 13744 / JCM 10971 / SI) TaxID=370438 RepID=A5CYR7_PELTS|nr:predicted Zn-dependent hydrolases [Pelotomaculum thermopropionicum SI]
MIIQWLGHACFLIAFSDGRVLMTDPFGPEVGYPRPAYPADVVTVSHQHFDHNAVKQVPGRPRVIEGEGRHDLEGITITGVPSFHDSSKGGQRGKNTIFVIEAEGLRVCHLGDLGHVLEEEQVEQIGRVDVLMIPVGGFYTIGAGEAVRVVEQLKPKYVLPMHYKTSYIDFPISTADDFLSRFPGCRREQELRVTADSLPASAQAVIIELKK